MREVMLLEKLLGVSKLKWKFVILWMLGNWVVLRLLEVMKIIIFVSVKK